MDLKLKGQVAVVTGGSRGIGKVISLALAREGARVAIIARDRNFLEQTVGKVKEQGGEAIAISADLSSDLEIQKAVEQTLCAMSTVDILVNNLGGIRHFAPFEEISDQQWMQMFELNVFSNVRVTRAFLPIMQKIQRGRIINISSEVAVQPDPKAIHYSAAKACINNITKSLAKAYSKQGILINSISPSFTLTEEIEQLLLQKAKTMNLTLEQMLTHLMKGRSPFAIDRPARGEEIASLVLYLASDLSSFVTGTNFRIDGGTVEAM